MHRRLLCVVLGALHDLTAVASHAVTHHFHLASLLDQCTTGTAVMQEGVGECRTFDVLGLADEATDVTTWYTLTQAASASG